MKQQRELSDAAPRKTYGCHGAAFGGCLLPFTLLILAAASGDTGGPLFWPILAGFLGLILADLSIVGTIFVIETDIAVLSSLFVVYPINIICCFVGGVSNSLIWYFKYKIGQ